MSQPPCSPRPVQHGLIEPTVSRIHQVLAIASSRRPRFAADFARSDVTSEREI